MSQALPSEYFRTNIAITTTGVFSHAALIAAIQEVGVDNVMFSIDYPFESTEQAVQFIRTARLAPGGHVLIASPPPAPAWAADRPAGQHLPFRISWQRGSA
jgi:predicted TIM-barrel fold metal-dependent hydrolase